MPIKTFAHPPSRKISFLSGNQYGVTRRGRAGSIRPLLIGAVAIRAMRNRQRPKFSLSRLLGMSVASSVAILSGMHWQHSKKALEVARLKYVSAMARYDPACPDEKLAHKVTPTHPFYMGKIVVIQEQYQAVMGSNPSPLKGRDNQASERAKQELEWIPGGHTSISIA